MFQGVMGHSWHEQQAVPEGAQRLIGQASF